MQELETFELKINVISNELWHLTSIISKTLLIGISITAQQRRITDKEYGHVLHVWNKFEMKTRKDYHNLYLKCDILLSADVFQKFRNNIIV